MIASTVISLVVNARSASHELNRDVTPDGMAIWRTP